MAMVPLIDEKNCVRFGKDPGVRLPVVGASEKSMEHKKRRTLA
jgi:hypothetical protein